MKINRNSKIPVYVQLADLIKNKIENGEIKPGEKLPSESEMVKEHGVARLTVREALSRLVNDGLVEKHHGKGTFCKNNLPPKNIDVILDMSDYYFIPFYMQSISNVLEQNNCNLVVYDNKNSPDEILKLLERISLSGSDGVILQGSTSRTTDIQKLRSAIKGLSPIPVIIIDHNYNLEDLPSVTMDDFEAGKIIGEYFFENGHKNVTAVCVADNSQSDKRLEGFKSIYKACNIITVNDCMTKEKPELKKPLLECVKNDTTAVFCFNDHLAKKSIDYLTESGFKVPDDISVTGVDDTIIAKLYNLTTIVHPKQLLGEYAAGEIIKDTMKSKVFVPYLKERTSVKKI